MHSNANKRIIQTQRGSSGRFPMSLKADAEAKLHRPFLFQILFILWTHFLRLGLAIRPPVKQALSFRTLDRIDSAGGIINAKGDAVIPLEGDLVDIAL